MKIDVSIERISNGYIVTGNDSTREKRYYPNLEAFAEVWIIELLRESDICIREHEAPTKPFHFKLESDL